MSGEEMQLGVIGLGRMGGNIVRRLMRNGHNCVVYDLNADAVRELAGEGASASRSLEDLVAQLDPPRPVWVMLPAGEVTEQTVRALAELMAPGDIVMDGGNSYYKDDIRRAQALKPKGLRYVDIGTSGGIWGIERGYCMMIGGDKDVVPARFRARRTGRAAIRGRRRAISMPARAVPGTSSRWSTTASSTA
jgi:6-phosphogluconate dehydrogenase